MSSDLSTPAAVDAASSFRVRLRFAVWAFLVVGIIAGQIGWLWLLRGSRILDSDAVLIGGQVLLGGALIGLGVLLNTTPPNAIRLRRQTSSAIILTVAALLQLAAVTLLWPGLSDDAVRYRLDGRMWLAGVSPYAVTPEQYMELAADDARLEADAVDRLVSFPDLHTIYPPAAQAVFIVAAAIERALPFRDGTDSDGHEASWRERLSEQSAVQRVLVLRAIFAVAAVACVAVLLGILRRMQISAWWSVLFAWHPLVTLECGGMGHQDILGALLILAAIRLMQRHRGGWSAAMLALAGGVKPFAVLLLPFLWRRAKWQGAPASRDATIHAIHVPLIFVAATALLLLPLLYQQGYAGWLTTGRTFAERWEANGSLYALWVWAFGADGGESLIRARQTARLLPVAALAVTAVLLWRFRAGPASAGYWMFLALLLSASVVYPWYLIWMLCLVPSLRGGQGWTGLVWCATVGVSYLLWRQDEWSLPLDLLLLQYTPVYLALILELAWLGRLKRRENDPPAASAGFTPACA